MIKKVKQYLAQHPRLRVLAIVGAGVAIIMIVFKAFSYTAPIDVSVPKSSINTTVGPMNQAAPQIEQQKIKAYTQLADTKKHMQDVSSGKTVLQDVFKDEDEPQKDVAVDKDVAKESATVQKKASSSIVSRVKNLRSTVSDSKTKKSSTYKSRLRSQAATKSKQYNNTNLQQKLQKIQYQLQNYSNDWKQYPSMQQTAGSSSGRDGATERGAGGREAMGAESVIPSGTIYYGVLDTAINSDIKNAPVMAHIATGEYKGARLIGGFEQNKDRLLVSFNHMSFPKGSENFEKYPQGLSFQAYAIDPRTAQSALAQNVNYHRLLRYGSLFGSAFLQGFGNAFNQSQQSPCEGADICTITTSGFAGTTTKNAMYQGLGQIGTSLSQMMANNINRKPTVTIDQGAGVGLLFMTDAQVGSGSGNVGRFMAAQAQAGASGGVPSMGGGGNASGFNPSGGAQNNATPNTKGGSRPTVLVVPQT